MCTTVRHAYALTSLIANQWCKQTPICHARDKGVVRPLLKRTAIKKRNEWTKNGFLAGEHSSKQKSEAAAFPISHPQRNERGGRNSARKGGEGEQYLDTSSNSSYVCTGIGTRVVTHSRVDPAIQWGY